MDNNDTQKAMIGQALEGACAPASNTSLYDETRKNVDVRFAELENIIAVLRKKLIPVMHSDVTINKDQTQAAQAPLSPVSVIAHQQSYMRSLDGHIQSLGELLSRLAI